MIEQQIIQGGAVGLTILVIGILFWVIKWLCQHLDRNNKVLAENASAIQALKEATIKNSAITGELVTYFKKLNGNLGK
jgi:hypothetical protein